MCILWGDVGGYLPDKTSYIWFTGQFAGNPDIFGETHGFLHFPASRQPIQRLIGISLDIPGICRVQMNRPSWGRKNYLPATRIDRRRVCYN